MTQKKEFNLIDVVETPKLSLVGPEVKTEDYMRDFFGGPRTEENAQQWDRKLDELDREERKYSGLMSPAGALGLPPLLDQRRLEWKITDGAFNLAPIYDRVYLHQIPMEVDGKKGRIHMPDTVKSGERRRCPRGVLVGAGLLALDAVRSNGMDLGHIVRFIHVNPWRLIVDYTEGFFPEVMVMTAGSLTGSEDLALMLRSGAMKVQMVDGKHRYVDAEGNAFDPTMPYVPEDL